MKLVTVLLFGAYIVTNVFSAPVHETLKEKRSPQKWQEPEPFRRFPPNEHPGQRGPFENGGPPRRGPPDNRGPPDRRGPPDNRGPPSNRGPPGNRGPPVNRGPPDNRDTPNNRSPPDNMGPSRQETGPKDQDRPVDEPSGNIAPPNTIGQQENENKAPEELGKTSVVSDINKEESHSNGEVVNNQDRFASHNESTEKPMASQPATEKSTANTILYDKHGLPMFQAIAVTPEP